MDQARMRKEDKILIFALMLVTGIWGLAVGTFVGMKIGSISSSPSPIVEMHDRK